MRKLQIFMLMLLPLLTACGGGDEFVIKCNIRDLGTESVEMYYINRGVQHSVFHAVDGKVELHGSSATPTLVEVFKSDNTPLFRCIAANGDVIKVKLDPGRPEEIEVKGNDASEQLARFMSANDSLLRTRDVAAINRLVAEEVRSHPDRVSAAAILATCFRARGYELLADSLVNALKPSARPAGVMGAFPDLVGSQVSSSARGSVRPMTFYCGYENKKDTTVRYWPSGQSYSLIAVTAVRRPDSVRRVLKELTDSLPLRRFKVIEVAVTGDSAQWASNVTSDKEKWMQAWVPGGVGGTAIRPLQIPAIPFFIVADSTGRQIYRGYSIFAASDTVRSRLSAHISKVDADDDAADSPLATPESLDKATDALDDAADGSSIGPGQQYTPHHRPTRRQSQAQKNLQVQTQKVEQLRVAQ